MNQTGEPGVRIGQFSAYYGDRNSAIGELLASDCDVLTGDYLAELTMLVLKKTSMRGGPGYAEGFLSQVREHLPEIANRDIKLVTNAGGLDPEGCADALRKICEDAGLDLVVASISGDNQINRLDALTAEGADFSNIDTGEILDTDRVTVLTANAYLGAWPITEALKRGADIVICPRVTDAALVIGAAAWHHGWTDDSYDELAGALAAGHIIECGCQATGGNYSEFDESDDLGLPGMPIAEIHSDGTSVITKAANTGGIVDVGTVTAQLLYEVSSRFYHNPDVIADLATTKLDPAGPDRVAVSQTRGFAPTDQLKLSLAYEGGYRNQVVVGLTGGRIREKEAWLRRQVEDTVGTPDAFDKFRWSRIGPMTETNGTYNESTALVVITAKDHERSRVSRASFSDRITQLGTSSIPGFYTFTPPAKERLFGVQWPTLIPKSAVTAHIVLADRTRVEVPWGPHGTPPEYPAEAAPTPRTATSTPTTLARLDAVLGTRSGDKAGMANLGLWARNLETHAWLVEFLTVERLRELIPELADLNVVRHRFDNLFAINFLLHGWLEDGVASCTRIDAQAKGVGEYVGSLEVPIPMDLIAIASATH